MSLYREFELKTEEDAQRLYALLKTNWRAVADTKPILVIVTNNEKKRNNLQNARYWKAVLEPISQQAWVGGRQYDTATWHEYYAEKLLEKQEMTLPGGSLFKRRKSTTELTVKEFAEYMTRIEVEASQELGVRFYVMEV